MATYAGPSTRSRGTPVAGRRGPAARRRVLLVEPAAPWTGFDANALQPDAPLPNYAWQPQVADRVMASAMAGGDDPASVATTVVAAATDPKPTLRYASRARRPDASAPCAALFPPGRSTGRSGSSIACPPEAWSHERHLRPRLSPAGERAPAGSGRDAGRPAALRHRLPGGSRVLEAGCGVGAQTVTLARRSPEARFTSVDVSAASIAEARRRADAAGLTNVEFRQADIFALPFAAASFDHVFVCFVLEHLARPVEALAILKRLLRPGRHHHRDRGRPRIDLLPSRQPRGPCGDPVPGRAAARGRRRRADRPAALPADGRGRLRRGAGLAPHGVCRFEPARPGRRIHQEDVHRDDRGHSRARDRGGSHRRRSASTPASGISTARPRPTACSATRSSRAWARSATPDPSVKLLRRPVGRGPRRPREAGWPARRPGRRCVPLDGAGRPACGC